MRLLIDMNLSPKWVKVIEQAGLNGAHWMQLGSPYASDPEIMAYAKANGFVVLTNDLDFGAILAATGGEAPSVVQIRTEDCRVEIIGAIVIDAINLAADQLNTGALVTIDAGRMRVTALPIKAIR